MQENQEKVNYKKCNSCGIDIAKNLSNCPFCGAFSPVQDKTPIMYEIVDHKKIKLSQLVPNMAKVLLVANVIVALINIILLWLGGGFADFNLQKLWCLYPLAGSLLIFITVLLPLLINAYYWNEFFYQILTLIGFILLVDLFSDSAISWSLTFVVPIYIAFISVVMSFILYIKKANVDTVLLLLLAIFLLSTLQFILSATVFVWAVENFIILPSAIGFIVTLGVFLCGILIKREAVVKMFKRRFHA